MEWEFEASGPVDADIGIPAGLIDVVAAAEGTVGVTLEALHRGRRAEELVAAAEVSFGGGKLRIELPERRIRSVEVRCTVSLPPGSSLTTRTASAGLRCPVRLARFSGTTASGDVVLAEVEADVDVKSASGDLEVAEVGGKLAVRTASGDVSVRRTAGDVHVASASGDLELGDAGGPVKVESASGDVTIGRASSGRVHVSTASGDVTVGVAAGVGAYLDVSTVSGSTSTTLPFSEEAVDAAVLEIVCRTVSGDVTIRKAAP